MSNKEPAFARGHEVDKDNKFVYVQGTRFIINNNLLGKVYVSSFKKEGEIFLSGEFEKDAQLASLVNSITRLFSKAGSWEESLEQLGRSSSCCNDLPGQLLGLLSKI